MKANMKAKKNRILVVDDERDICRALEFILSSEGYGVETVSSGEDALRKFQKKHFDYLVAVQLLLWLGNALVEAEEALERYESEQRSDQDAADIEEPQ